MPPEHLELSSSSFRTYWRYPRIETFEMKPLFVGIGDVDEKKYTGSPKSDVRYAHGKRWLARVQDDLGDNTRYILRRQRTTFEGEE